METPAEHLESGDVRLRRWRAEDAAEAHRVVHESMDHLAKWVSWVDDGYPMATAERFVRDCERNWAEGTSFDYAILVDGGIAGSCGLMTRAGPDGLELGYWLAKSVTGRGVATTAARLLTEEAFRVGAQWVLIVHDSGNVASGRVPARLGYTKIEERPSEIPCGTEDTGVATVWRLDHP